MHSDHLIIGGGIAGATAAETIRQRDPRASVRIIAAERHPVYSRVLLPHVADGRAKEDRVIIRTAAALETKGIAYDAGAVASSVDAKSRTVELADGSTATYGKLLIASGSDARRFEGPGAEHCSYFRTLDDLRALTSTARVGNALVYGGGFNAIDLAVSLVRRGSRVTCAMRGDGFLSRALDPRSRQAIHASLEAHGITILPRQELRAVERKIGGLDVHLSGGKRSDQDLVGVSVGVVPNVGFVADSGIALRAGVLVDERLRAADDVFAAGDVAEYLDTSVGEHRIAGNWMNAMFQGKAAAVNMTGGDEPFTLVTSYSIASFELPIAFMGATDVAGDERIVRPSATGALQLVIKGDRVVGATCVGAFTDRAAVTRLIGGRTPLSEAMRRGLADPRTDLIGLLP